MAPMTSGATATRAAPSPPGRAPWRSRRAAAMAAGSRRASAVARAHTRSDVWRRRATPRAGPASRTIAPTMRCVPDSRRMTSRSPAATASGAARRTIAPADPFGSSSASRPARLSVPSTAAVPRWTRARVRSGQVVSIWISHRSLAVTTGSSVRTTPRCRLERDPPLRLSAVRPGPADPTEAPWTWTSRTRTVPSPGTSLSVAPVASGPPRRVPVTTSPRPLTWKTRSIARREPDEAAPRSPTAMRARSRRSTNAIRNASRPVPRVDETGTTGDPSNDVPASRPMISAVTARVRASPATSIFVTTTMPCRSPRADNSDRCSIVCARGPSSAATTRRAASISPAPTSMLPTRRSWPGTSTKSSSLPSGSVRCA